MLCSLPAPWTTMRTTAGYRTNRLELGSKVTTYMADARNSDWWLVHLQSIDFSRARGSEVARGLVEGEYSSPTVDARMDAVQAQVHVAAGTV